MTADRQKWTNRIRQACLRESDDVDAATTAAEYLVTAVDAGLVHPEEIPDDRERMSATLSVLDDALARMRPMRDVALSVDGGVARPVGGPLSAEERATRRAALREEYRLRVRQLRFGNRQQ